MEIYFSARSMVFRMHSEPMKILKNHNGFTLTLHKI